MKIASSIFRKCEDDRGVAAIEFAMLLPVMMFAIFGCSELLCQIYTRSLIQSFVSQGARQSIVGTADMASIEETLRERIEGLPGVHKGGDLDIRICQQKGCTTAPVVVAEYVDANNNNTCDNNEKWKDYNRNNVKEKAGTLVTGNTLGGPNEPVVFEVQATADYFFGSLSFLGDIAAESQIQNFTITAVGTNEDFSIAEVTCV